MNEIVIKKISTDSKEYNSSLKLRDIVLRKPIGLSIEDDDLSQESLAEHFVAVKNREVIGTLFLTPTSQQAYQMKQVAVHPDYQGQSIGKQVIAAAEKWGRENKVNKIWLHARINAWPFYQKQGYEFISEEYTQVGIVHKTMEKRM